MEFLVPKAFSTKTLNVFLVQLQGATGAEIGRETRVVLTSDDPQIVHMLSLLFGRQPPASAPVEMAPCCDLPASKTWEILDSSGEVSERLSIEEKNLRLAAGKFEQGARLRYQRTGKLVTVTGKPGRPQGLS